MRLWNYFFWNDNNIFPFRISECATRFCFNFRQISVQTPPQASYVLIKPIASGTASFSVCIWWIPGSLSKILSSNSEIVQFHHQSLADVLCYSLNIILLLLFNIRIEPLGYGRLIIHDFVSRSTFILARLLRPGLSGRCRLQYGSLLVSSISTIQSSIGQIEVWIIIVNRYERWIK